MNIVSKLIKYVSDGAYRFKVNTAHGFYDDMPDKVFLQRAFQEIMGYELDLEHPKTYCEKMQWLKLYNRQLIYTTMVDKYEAKKYIAEKIGEQYVIPTFGVWDRVEDIELTHLPEQFVLKTTHDSGGVVICKDKRQLDFAEAKKILNKHLNRNYFYCGREWPYKNVVPRILAEKLLQSEAGNEIQDYKIHCFNGKAKILYVTSDRFNGRGLKADYFDANFNKLDIRWELPNSNYTINKPVHFELMKTLAERLSEGIPTIRVDFYEVDGKVYVGELTFFDGSGFCDISGDWDNILGDWIGLPPIRQC